MEDATKRFMDLLEHRLIPDFCSNRARNMNPSGFCANANLTNLSEIDKVDFLRGWDAQLLEHIDSGRYRSGPQSGAFEQFFWSGLKATTPRTFTIWIEPIIALGVLARMYLDFNWPKALIGTQTKRKWAFDVFGCKSEYDPSLLVACEVKKSRKEINTLIGDMELFGRQPSSLGEHLKGAKRNSYMKLKALREDKPRIFWAVGPDRYEKVFSILYLEDDVIEFTPKSTDALLYNASY